MAIGDEQMRAQLRRAARQAMQQGPVQEGTRALPSTPLAGAGNQRAEYHDQTGEAWWGWGFAWNNGTWG